MLLVPPRRLEREMLDEPDRVLPHLAANLTDIRRLNQWFGGTSIMLRYARDVLRGCRQARVLDVATGSADIPLAVQRWSRSHDLMLDIVACDISEPVLHEARHVVGEAPITLVQADARQLPWPAGTFDLVTCSLALHHFDPHDARTVLMEMWRVCRGSCVVVDLSRSHVGFGAVWLLTHVAFHNTLTRHDGPLSVQRAYTLNELEHLARAADLANVQVRRHVPFRLAMVSHKAVVGG